MLPTDDPQKLEAALEQLEAEKQRRIAEKIANGKAVVHSDVIVIGLSRDDDEATPVKRDAEGREIYHVIKRDADGREIYSERPLTIITGVPRSGRDVPAPDPSTQVHNVSKPETENPRRPEGQALRLAEGDPLRASLKSPPPEPG